jgi:hypothetical protein
MNSTPTETPAEQPLNMLMILLSLLSRLFFVVAQCSLEGASAEALDKFPCLPTSTLTDCQNLYDPIKVDNVRAECAVLQIMQAHQRAVECINNCGNDGPCVECNRGESPVSMLHAVRLMSEIWPQRSATLTNVINH